MNGLHSGHMSTPQIAEHRAWGWRGSVGAIAVAAVIAAVGGAAIYAATEGTSHPFGASHQPGPQVGMHGAMGAPGQSDSAPQSLHGESVVADGNGGYRTELTQTGTVTAVSPTSITVRSADGYTQSYVIPSAARNAGAPLAVDAQVAVRATRDAQTAIVTSIGNPPPDLGGSGSAPTHRN